MSLGADTEQTSKRRIGQRKAPALPPHWRQRTKAGNGDPGALSGVDMRGAVGRRFREVGALLSSDLGGFQHLSQAQQLLVRSVCGLVCLREALDVRVIDGEKVNVPEYCTLSNSLLKTLVALGLRREARDAFEIDGNDQAIAAYQQALNGEG
jgi:hypothetical protein